jgi:hypothetical protein
MFFSRILDLILYSAAGPGESLPKLGATKVGYPRGLISLPYGDIGWGVVDGLDLASGMITRLFS